MDDLDLGVVQDCNPAVSVDHPNSAPGKCKWWAVAAAGREVR